MSLDPLRYFRVEARELVEQLGQGLLDLEKAAAPETVARVLRVAHTLKGAARVVRQATIAELAHRLEDALAPLRDARTGAAPRSMVDTALSLVDAMTAALGDLAPVRAQAASPSPASELAPSPAPAPAAVPAAIAPEPARTMRADVAELDSLLTGVAAVHAQLAPVRAASTLAERSGHVADLLAGHLAAPRGRDVRAGDRPMENVRALADELRTLAGRLARLLSTGVEAVERELGQLREHAEGLRMLPASALLPGLERALRDVARVQGKQVSFQALGGEVRLDVHVVSALQGALVQLMRNAVAHGIESPAERRAAGKSPQGLVTLTVERRGRRVWFTCRDDGRGVDIDAVRQALQHKGVALPAAGGTAAEVLQLLLRGGVTTSASVTDMAGRGIGLDVVRDVLTQLGGDVTLHAEAGRGTSVELWVPLSMASIDALIVGTGEARAAVPLNAVVGTVQVNPTDVVNTPEGGALMHQGKLLPFLPLAQALGRRRSDIGGRKLSGVVIAGTATSAVIGVERLFGAARVTVRPLPDLAPASAVVAGAWLDADANPQLVLDAEALVAEAARDAAMAAPEAEELPPILVVDDSLTTRMLEQSILESAGYQVEVATSAEEALQKLAVTRYALALVDVEMPGLDGFGLLARMQADARLRDLPAILVTSRSSQEDRQRGAEVGARGYVVKGEFDQGELLRRIRELVAR
ncbi:MAG: response regulator [Deltaproteobacteria bacterium]|nr:response regulator [Deltaproteobacteria bacterium]